VLAPGCAGFGERAVGGGVVMEAGAALAVICPLMSI
jgi:hypothetical protein